MYSHIASNDTTEPLNFENGWMTNTTIALVSGGVANFGTSEGKRWIDLQTNAQLIRLVGVDFKVHSGKAPAEDSDFFYFPVYPDKYLQVAKSATVDRVFSHTHQTSFDNVYGSGSKPTVGQIIGKAPVDLLSDTTGIRVDGTSFADVIILNDKGSTAYSNDGHDTVYGGLGADTMFGGRGKDWLYGGGGKDTLNGDNGNDRLYGGADNDTLRGGAGKDSLYGDDGEDTLYGEWQNDRLYGGADNDALYGGDNNDVLYGGAGEDVLYGGTDKDTLYGEADNDRLYGGADNDKLYGGIAQDELYGGAGNDRLYGGDDNDTLYGGKGNDQIWAGVGQDAAYGGAGNDRIYGEASNDWLHGDKGNDRIYGGDANDFLYGGAGNDRIYGGRDNDRLFGGPGKDLLSGGSGADTFVFNAKPVSGNVDRVTDFEVGTDGVWLSAKVFKKLPLGPVAAEYFHRGSKAADKNDHLIYDQKKGVLIYDKNGSAKGGASVIAKFDKKPDLHNSDFYVKTDAELYL